MQKLIFPIALVLSIWSCTKDSSSSLPAPLQTDLADETSVSDRDNCSTSLCGHPCTVRFRVNSINGATTDIGALLRVTRSLSTPVECDYLDWFVGCDVGNFFGTQEVIGNWYYFYPCRSTGFVVALREVNLGPEDTDPDPDCDQQSGSVNYTIESGAFSETFTLNYTLGFPGPTFESRSYSLGSNCSLAADAAE